MCGGPGSSVGIAIGYGLEGPGIESRWEARFSAPVQTGPGAHPASCTMGKGSFPGVKSGRGVTLTPYPLLVQWSWKSRAIPLLPLQAVRPVHNVSACTRVNFTFTFHLHVYIISMTNVCTIHNLKDKRWRSWLEHCSIVWNSGSIPDGVTGIFHWRNRPDLTIAHWSTQPLT